MSRLLLVEDEEHLAYTLEFNLREEGYAVDRAPTLSAARRLLGERPDLVVLDVMLPDGSGFDFCRELRQSASRVPVLMLTAKGNCDDIVSGLESGADDYLTKPFALGELLGRIAAMLRRSGWSRQDKGQDPAAPREVRFGRSVVDFESRKVVARGRPATLTELELRLVRFFARHEGEVVTRDAILESVWEMPAGIQTRTVDNFLVRLRRLFERDPARPQHFLTVRGYGYRFVAHP